MAYETLQEAPVGIFVFVFDPVTLDGHAGPTKPLQDLQNRSPNLQNGTKRLDLQNHRVVPGDTGAGRVRSEQIIR